METSQLIEKWSEIIYVMVAQVTPISSMAIKLIAIFYIYFTTDLKNDSFQLPFPTWLVTFYFFLRSGETSLFIIFTEIQGYHLTGKIQLVLQLPSRSSILLRCIILCYSPI